MQNAKQRIVSFCLFIVSLQLVACASVPDAGLAMAIRTQDRATMATYVEGSDALQADSNRFLRFAEQGRVEWLLGDFDLAVHSFEQAHQVAFELLARSGSETTQMLLTNDANTRYRVKPYEALMVNYYSLLARLAMYSQGEPQRLLEARIDAMRIINWNRFLQNSEEYLAVQIEERDKKQLWQAIDGEFKPPILNTPYVGDPWITLMAAWVMKMNGEDDNQRILQAQAKSLYEFYQQRGYYNGRVDHWAYWQRLLQEDQPRVHLIHSELAPEKFQFDVPTSRNQSHYWADEDRDALNWAGFLTGALSATELRPQVGRPVAVSSESSPVWFFSQVTLDVLNEFLGDGAIDFNLYLPVTGYRLSSLAAPSAPGLVQNLPMTVTDQHFSILFDELKRSFYGAVVKLAATAATANLVDNEGRNQGLAQLTQFVGSIYTYANMQADTRYWQSMHAFTLVEFEDQPTVRGQESPFFTLSIIDQNQLLVGERL